MLSSPCKSMESYFFERQVLSFRSLEILCRYFFAFFPPVSDINSIMETKSWPLSYSSQRSVRKIWTYDSLRDEVLDCKANTISFLMDKGVLKSRQNCTRCGSIMSISKCNEHDAAEEVHFRCQKSHYDSESKGRHELLCLYM